MATDTEATDETAWYARGGGCPHIEWFHPEAFDEGEDAARSKAHSAAKDGCPVCEDNHGLAVGAEPTPEGETAPPYEPDEEE